jgi:hypothetical protein
MRNATLLLILALLGGCSKYNFQLTEPRELAQTIGYSDPAIVKLPPLDYHMQAAENRLVMKIYNTSEEQINFLGDRSYAVAPDGQSHPLPNQSIAPHSFIKLILPPMPPVYPAQPVFGIGVSYSQGYPFGWYDPDFGRPIYLSAAGSGAFYWSWPGESSVPLRLTFQKGSETFHQDFTFQKRKV